MVAAQEVLLDKNLSIKYADSIGAFLQSDIWRIIKYRLDCIYKVQVQKNVNSNVKNNNPHGSAINYGKVEATEEIISITEHIGGEIMKGQLDVDEILHVIENNRRK